MHSTKKISCSLTTIRDEPNLKSNKISEALFGEDFKIVKHIGPWCYGKLVKDGYEGWLNNSSLCEHVNCTHKVCVPCSVLKEQPNIKSLDVEYIFLGSELNVLSLDSDWAKVLLPSSFKDKYSYLPTKHIQKMSTNKNNWIDLSEQFVGTPYVWGGRSYSGVDCSGLVQICLQSSGIFCPRDSNLQFRYFKEESLNLNELKRGMLIFWEGHVGIVISKTSILHSNAFHMSTTIENLEDLINRMEENNIKFLGLRNPI